MKTLKQRIQEAFRINQDNKPDQYTCQPKDRDELQEILEKRLEEDPDADLNDIDVSEITNMFKLFYKLNPHNINISDWDVSNVTDMSYMFCGCDNFNCDLSNWDVSKVTDMSYMFMGCKNFNCDLSNWNVSKVENIKMIFSGCNSLKNIPSW